MIYTTLNKIRAHGPCNKGWEKLLKSLGKTSADDEPLSLEYILDSNGLDDALWCCRAVDGHDREFRLFAVWCALQVVHLNPDPRVAKAVEVAESYANGKATRQELDIAGAAAWGAEAAAEATVRAVPWGAAGAAAWSAAGKAAWGAEAAARTAARAIAEAIAWGAAGTVAWGAAGKAAWDTARVDQKEVFRWVVNGGLRKFEKGDD